MTGWDLVDTYDGGVDTHVLARLPDGRFLDINGLHPAADFPTAAPFEPCDCAWCNSWAAIYQLTLPKVPTELGGSQGAPTHRWRMTPRVRTTVRRVHTTVPKGAPMHPHLLATPPQGN